MRLRPKNGRERRSDSSPYVPKKRFPLPVPKRLKGKMTDDESRIWRLFNQPDLIAAMESDDSDLVFDKRGQKLDQIRHWIEFGEPEATLACGDRSKKHRKWCRERARKKKPRSRSQSPSFYERESQFWAERRQRQRSQSPSIYNQR